MTLMTLKNSFKTSRLFVVALAMTFVLLFFVQAHALYFNFGADSSVNTLGTHDVLQMVAEVDEGLDDVDFHLSSGQSSEYIPFATLWTNESWINEDDLNPGNVVANVHFDNPDILSSANGIASVDGDSIGFSAYWGFAQGWNLHWDDPVIVPVDDGFFSLELSDVHYASWFWQGPGGSNDRQGRAEVFARVTYQSASVPDASIMFLLGPALIGLGIWGRKKN